MDSLINENNNNLQKIRIPRTKSINEGKNEFANNSVTNHKIISTSDSKQTFSLFRLVRVTCEGNLNDPNFPGKLKTLLTKLKTILSNGKNLIKVTKVEPWNSVRVTLNLSDDAAQQLRQLAEHGDENLRDIGILSVQLDGQQVISLNLPDHNTAIVNNATRNNQSNVFTIDNAKISTRDEKCIFDNNSRINGTVANDESSDSGGSICNSETGGILLDNNNVPGQQPKLSKQLQSYMSQKSKIESITNTATTSSSSSSSIDSVENQSIQQQKFHSQPSLQTQKFVNNSSIIDQLQVKLNYNNNNKNHNTSQVQNESTTTNIVVDHNATRDSPVVRDQMGNKICLSHYQSANQLQNKLQAHPSNVALQNNSNNNLIRTSQTDSTLSDTASTSTPSKLVPAASNYPSQVNKATDNSLSTLSHRSTNKDNPNESMFQRKSLNNSGYHQPSIQQINEPLMNKTDTQQPTETGQTTNVLLVANNLQSSDILDSSIDAVDDDLLASVAGATGADPNTDFTELNDLNLLSMLEEMETTTSTTTTATNQNVPTTTATGSTSDVIVMPGQVVNDPSRSTVNKADTVSDDNRTTAAKSLPFFLSQKPSLPPQQHSQSASMAKIPNSQSILINSSNTSSVLSTAVAQQSSTNQQQPSGSNNNNNSTTGTSTSTIFPFGNAMFHKQQQQAPMNQPSLHQQQQASAQSVQQQSPSNSSPRQIYVPARTQQSWRTAAVANATTSLQQSSPSSNNNANTSNNNKRNQQQQSSTVTLVNNELTSPVSQQQQTARFVPNNGNSSLARPPTAISIDLSGTGTQQQNKPQQQPILIRQTSVGTLNQQQQSSSQSSTTNINSGTQNAVALSSPLLVNLLQSDVPSNSNSSSLQHQQQQQQSQFINQPAGTQQIRLIAQSAPHTVSDGTTGAPVRTQHTLMMVRVSSADGTTHQLINPVTANMVSVPSNQNVNTVVVSQSNIDQSSQMIMAGQPNNNNNNNNNTANDNNTLATKPKKQRKPRNKNQTESMSDSSSVASGQSTPVATPTTPTSGNFSGTISSIPLSQNTGDMSARIQTSAVSTFLTIPTNSVAQSIKFPLGTSSNNVQQTLLSPGGQSGGHAIFNQKQRVQPVVMITNSNIDSNTANTNQANTFIINMSPNSLNTNQTSPSMTPTSTTSGVQLSGNRKQIFLATKSNSFPVSSALSAGAIVARFANSPSQSSSSSTTMVSSPVKLISQQQPQSSPNILTNPMMSPNELRNMSAVGTSGSGQQQTKATVGQQMLPTTPNKSSPSSIQQMTSSMQTSLSMNTNLMASNNSGSNTISTVVSNNSVNVYGNSNSCPPTPSSSTSASPSSNNSTMLQSSPAAVVSIANVSSIRATKSPHTQQQQQQQEQLLIAPSSSASISNQTTSNIHQQTTVHNNATSPNIQFQTTALQIPKNNQPSFLLNKLSQPNQILTKLSPLSTNQLTKIPLKTPIHMSNIVPKQLSLSSTDESQTNPVMENTTFVVKNADAPVSNLVHRENKLVAKNLEAHFIATETGTTTDVSKLPEHVTKNSSVINFKPTLVEMLDNSSTDKLDSVFLDDDSGRISEPSGPISPSYFLAPASAFDMNKCDQKTSELKKENDDNNENSSNQQKNDDIQDSKIKTENVDTTTSSNAVDATTITTSSTTSTQNPESNSTTKSSSNETSKKNPYENPPYFVLKRNYSQDLPDHILDDDEEDGDDSDPDDFGFYLSKNNRFLSGSIGSIGGAGSNTTKSSSQSKSSENSGSQKSTADQQQSISQTPKKEASCVDVVDSKQQQQKPDNVEHSTENKNVPTAELAIKNKNVEDDKVEQKVDDRSSKLNLTNGDISQSSSNSDELNTANLETHDVQEKQQFIATKSTVASKSYPIKMETSVDSQTTSIMAMVKMEEKTKPTEMPKTPVKTEKSETTPPRNVQGNNSRRTSTPVTPKSSPNKSKSRRKISTPETSNTTAIQSLLLSSSDSSIVSGSEKNPTTIVNVNSDNNDTKKQQPQQQQQQQSLHYITVKHPSTITTTNQTLGQFLQPQPDNVTTSSTSTVVATSVASAVNSTSNPKLRFVCIQSGGQKYLSIPQSSSGQTNITDVNNPNAQQQPQQQQLLYRVPNHGGPPFGQIVVVKQVVMNSDSSDNSGTSPTQFKLKLPTSVAQGTSQPLFIPMVATSNNQGILSVKPTGQVVTTNELPTVPVSNIKPIVEQQPKPSENESKFTIAKKTNIETTTPTSSNPPTPVSVTTMANTSQTIPINIDEKNNSAKDNDNSKSFPTESNDVHLISVDNKTNTQNASESNVQNVSNLSDAVTCQDEAQPESSIGQTKNNEESSDVDNVSVSEVNQESDSSQNSNVATNSSECNSGEIKPKDNQSVVNKSIGRALQILLPTNESGNVASSNLVILKTDGNPRVVKDKEQVNLSGSRSNSPNAICRPLYITKTMPVQRNSQTQLDANQSTTTIYATKSNNSITATKTLPSILRQSKRKSDALFQTQTLPIANIDTQSIKTADHMATGSSETSETDSGESTPVTLTFKPQQPKYQSLLSTNEDDSVSDQSLDSSSRQRKRARKSKVTTIQHVATTTSNSQSVFTNFANAGTFDNESNKTDSNEVKPTTTTPNASARILRNSSATAPQQQLSKATTTAQPSIAKRTQRNSRTLLSSNSATTATTTAATTSAPAPVAVPVMSNNDKLDQSICLYPTANETVVKSNDKNKKARDTNVQISTGSRQTRSNNRSRKKVSETNQTSTNTPIINLDSEPSGIVINQNTNADHSKLTGSTNPSITCPTTTAGNLITKNLNLPSMIGTVDGDSNNTGSASFNIASLSQPQQLNIISVPNTTSSSGNKNNLISILETSANLNPTNTGNNTGNNNNSLLVKRSRKSLPSQTNVPSGTNRPSLRNATAVGSETITQTSLSNTGSSGGTPAKRRRLNKDVSK